MQHSKRRQAVVDVNAEGTAKHLLRGKIEDAVTCFPGLLRGVESFDFDPLCVAVLASARFAPAHRYYQLAR